MNHRPDLIRAWDPEKLLHVHRKIQDCITPEQPNIQLIDDVFSLERSKSLGVFASSFNPPTLAHEALVRQALLERRYRLCLLILDLHHADKPLRDAVFEDRIMMAEIAFSDKHCAIGISSHGRFVDKLSALRSMMGSDGEVEFIVGADTLHRILDPRFYTEPESELRRLFDESAFLVFSRPEMSDRVDRQIQNCRNRGAKIVSTSLPRHLHPISSSLVRNRSASAADMTDLVSPGVLAFIKETGLYRPNDAEYAYRKSRMQSLFEHGPE